MPRRLLEILLPLRMKEDVSTLIKEHGVLDFWQYDISENRTMTRVLISGEESELILDTLQKRYVAEEGFRVVVLPVEANVPNATEKPVEPKTAAPKKTKWTLARVSRDEMYSEISEAADLTPLFVILIVLSAIVVGVGLLENNVAMIIGGMVLAPLMGANVALSLGSTLGDFNLASRALKTLLVGVAVSIGVGICFGILVHIDPTSAEISVRTRVHVGDVVIALGAGVAGSLAFTTRVSGTIVGVMVAVALMPPLVVFGMLLGSQDPKLAGSALLLLVANLIGINLSGVLAFVAQGVHPLHWWDKKKAQRWTLLALAIWTIILVTVLALIVLR
jgi:uncharacterized hydrophobic protein (TIGR00341 family)